MQRKRNSLFVHTVGRSCVGLALLGWAVVLGSCGGSQSEKGPVTVALALLPSERAPYARLLQEYTKTTGVEVKLVAQQYQQIRDALRAEAGAGSGQLDVVELDVYFLADAAGLVQPLDSLDPWLSEFRQAVSPEAWNAGESSSGGSEVLFVPHRLNWEAMIYDARILGQPPRTWSDLKHLAKTRSGSIGIKGARYEGLVCDFFPFLWESGGAPLDPGSTEALEALKLFADLRPGLQAGSIAFKENTVLQAQEHQEILLHFNWPFVVPLLREKGLLPGSIKTAPIPAGPLGSRTILGGGYLGIPVGAPHPRDAGRLLEYLTSEAVERRLLKELGWFPPRRSAWEALDDSTQREYQGFIAMKDDVRARPTVKNYEKISKLWQAAVAGVLFDGMEPTAAQDKLVRGLRTIDASGGDQGN